MKLWLLFLALLATATGQSVVMTILPPLGRELNLSEFQVATILATSALIFAVGTSYWGKLGFVFGRRRIIIVGLLGYTLGTLLFIYVFNLGLEQILTGSHLFMALLASRCAQSCIMSATPPSALALAVSGTTANNRMKAVSKVTMANSLGQIMGPALTGLLVSFGMLMPLYFITSLTLITLIIVTLKLPNEASAPSSPTTNNIQVQWSQLRYIIVAAAIFTALTMVYLSLPLLLMDVMEMGSIEATQKAGLGSMLISLTSLSIQLVFVQKARVSHQAILLLGLLGLVTGYTLLYLAQTLTTINIAMAIIGFGMGCSYPATTALATSSNSPQVQSKIAGYISGAPAIGFIIGFPVAATLYNFSPFAPFAMGAFIMLLTIIMLATKLSATR